MGQRILIHEQQLRSSLSTKSQSPVIKKKATVSLHKETECSTDEDSTESPDDELVLPGGMQVYNTKSIPGSRNLKQLN